MADTDNKDLDKQIEGMEKLQKAVHSAAETIKGISAGTLQKVAQAALSVKGAVDMISVGMKGLSGEVEKGKLKTTFYEAQKELKELDKALEKSPGNIADLARKYTLLNVQIEHTKDKMELLKKQSEKAQENMVNGSQKAQKEYKRCEKEISSTKDELQELKSKARDTKISLLFDNDATEKVKEIGERLKEVGSIALDVGKKAGSFLGGIAKSGIEYNAKKQSEGASEGEGGSFEEQAAALQENVETLKGELLGALTGDLFAALDEGFLPQINEWLTRILDTLSEEGIAGIPDVIQSIIDEALGMLNGNGQEGFLESGFSSLANFLDGLMGNLGSLAEAALILIGALADGLIECLPEITKKAGELIRSFIEGLSEHIPKLIPKAAEMIGTLIVGLTGMIPDLFSAALTLIGAIIDGIGSVDWISLANNIIDGLIKGLLGGLKALMDTVKKMASDVFNSVKNFFGIKSPSKKFQWIGEMSGEGYEVGFENSMDDAEKVVRRRSSALLGTFEANISYRLPSMSGLEKSLSANLIGNTRSYAQIMVPLSLDGREVARATAWWTGEQLSWEEM